MRVVSCSSVCQCLCFVLCVFARTHVRFCFRGCVRLVQCTFAFVFVGCSSPFSWLSRCVFSCRFHFSGVGRFNELSEQRWVGFHVFQKSTCCSPVPPDRPGNWVRRPSFVVRRPLSVRLSSMRRLLTCLSVHPACRDEHTTHTHTHSHAHMHTHKRTCVAHAVVTCLAMVCCHLLVCLFSSLWLMHGIRYDTRTATWMAKSLHQICTQLQQIIN